MKYSFLNPLLFVENRKRFAAGLKPNSMAVFFSNDIMPTNGDGVMGFVQHSDLFYLSGIDQEETILIIYPDAQHKQLQEVLFVKETNATIAVWEGAKLSKAEAQKVSGVKTVYWLKDFEVVLQQLIAQAEGIYLNSNEHPRKHITIETTEMRMNRLLSQKFSLNNIYHSAPIMQRLRMIKSADEVKLIKQACNITHQGFNRVLGFVKPGVMEYEIEAELSHEFIRNRSRGFAYAPIIASGANACVLHYTANNKPCKSGEVILIDAAAEYANYASDLTRCVPVSGKFTKRQKLVYSAVLRVLRSAVKMLHAGNTFKEYNSAVGTIMEKELVDLGLLSLHEIKKQAPGLPAYKKYFMHGTSHFLGLDVHDVGDYNHKMTSGMVLTCEPGIYIQEEKLGIRLENNILITDKGPLDLMAEIPIEADEIEERMHAGRV